MAPKPASSMLVLMFNGLVSMLTSKSRGSEEVVFGETCLLCLSRWEDKGSSRSVAKVTFSEKQNLPFPQKVSHSQLAALTMVNVLKKPRDTIPGCLKLLTDLHTHAGIVG